jgi:SPP1 family predicted phage head-tail adaptor
MAIPTLAAGRLREKITIRRQADVPDGEGGFVRSWTDFATVWAEVWNQSGREAVIGATLTGVSTFRITIRMQPVWRNGGGPQAADQVLWRGLELNIIAPPADPTGRGEALMFMADTSAPQGA